MNGDAGARCATGHDALNFRLHPLRVNTRSA